MKIETIDAVRPPKFRDKALNKTFGATMGRLSRDDVHSIVFRYAEVQAALEVRQCWLDQVKFVAESSEPNGEFHEAFATNPDLAGVCDEALEYLRLDQEQLAKEVLFARAHIALCDRVIAALTDAFADSSLTSAYRVVGRVRDGSPLRYLQDSSAAAHRAFTRVSAANKAWDSTITGFCAEANIRKAFAATAGSVAITKIDALPADMFEEWTAWLLERDGCTIVRRHGGPNDQGADVIAVTPDGLRVVLQCKHSTKLRNRVDSKYIYELNGTARQEHGADIVGITTNRTLSDAAQRFAVKHQIHVIDRPVLERWATFGVPWLPSDGRVTPAT